MRRSEDLGDGDPIHGNTGLEVVWTVIPAILWSRAQPSTAASCSSDIEDPKAGDEGDRSSPASSSPGPSTTPGEGVQGRRAPHGQGHALPFNLRAKEVIHSFWVPSSGSRRTRSPASPRDVRVTPNRNGNYAVVCTELCGLGHATMRAPIVVEDQASFDHWAAQRGEEPELVGANARRRRPLTATRSVRGRGLTWAPLAEADEEPGSARCCSARTCCGRPGWRWWARVRLRAGRRLRWLQDFPVFEGDPIVTVTLIAAPLGFLVGIGGFDYWGNG